LRAAWNADAKGTAFLSRRNKERKTAKGKQQGKNGISL